MSDFPLPGDHCRMESVMIRKTIMLCITLLVCTASAHASNFRWVDTQGTLHSLQEFRGKPVLLHFWASWCPPCRAEMPKLTAWIRANPDIAIIAVSLDRNPQDAEAFMQQQQYPLPILITDSREATRMGVRGLPTTMIIDAKGYAGKIYLGAQNWQNENFLQQLRTGLHL